MFTGLIQGLGTISLQANSQLKVYCPSCQFLKTVEIGDSIAVNGICLTVEIYDQQSFTVSVSPETISRSNLKSIAQAQALVNLEPALRVGDKVGGHFVSGHVDGVGTLTEIQELETSWELSFQAPPPVATYIVPKGSIAINGISLTVASYDAIGSSFTVAVISHTYQATNLQYLSVGAPVNLEADLLGKYAAKFQYPHLAPESSPGRDHDLITLEFLAEHGYG
ncbi:riboflavin synthase [Synechococcus sp. PCC 6312]|uniref:riboflavin synthase n=1 Tax=Synechococcus sp. (strain ATCC 27167 / PCC 6312) TaxID=195253 RepID=UPI00029EFC36|nr:riboflavin synthase [Synechococcus sp. PCC 6312]AFY59452.1 riboflavin synthase alpha chain [Synechococcus sp. PCC 6312]